MAPDQRKVTMFLDSEVFSKLESLATVEGLRTDELIRKILSERVSSVAPGIPSPESTSFLAQRLTDYSDEALVQEMQRVSGLISENLITKTAFRKISRVSPSTISKRFGGWRESLVRAGLAHRAPPVVRHQKSTVAGRYWNPGDVLEELQRIASLVGRENLTTQDFKEHSEVGLTTVRTRFGSWRAALEAAGLSCKGSSRRYTDLECFENLLNVWVHYGRPPKYQEMKLPPSKVGPKAYVIRWKSWNAALIAFEDFTIKDEDPGEQESVPLTIRTGQTKQVPPEDRRAPRLGLRYKVLVRDSFRCTVCGRSPANEAGCTLHIDHIFPFSKGGKTSLENLRVLCDICNLGKGDLVEEALQDEF